MKFQPLLSVVIADQTLTPTLITHNAELICGIDAKLCQFSGLCWHNTFLLPHNRRLKLILTWLIFTNNILHGGFVLCVHMHLWVGSGSLCILCSSQWKKMLFDKIVCGFSMDEEIGRPGLWLQTFWLYVQHKHLTKKVVLSHEPEDWRLQRQQRWSASWTQNMEVIYRTWGWEK